MNTRSLPRIALLAALLACPAAAQGTLFPISYEYPAINHPWGSAMAHLNGDARLDLVVANNLTDQISVFLGSGTGPFREQAPTKVADGPRAVALADLNGDGNADLAAACSSSHRISVKLGDGQGGFSGLKGYSTGQFSFPVCVAFGHLDGDANIDMVAATQSTVKLVVFLGDGAGGFSAPSYYPLDYSPDDIALGDVDGDGDLDVLSASNSGDRVRVMVGDGNGAFAQGPFFYAGNTGDMDIGDLNGDGVLDVVATRGNDYIGVYLGTGTGVFHHKMSYYTEDGPLDVMIGEFTGDDRPDLIIAGGSSKTLEVLVGIGGGDFGIAHTSPITERPTHAEGADVNGDGIHDVVTVSGWTNSIHVHLGGGSGGWEHYCTAKLNSLGCLPRIWGTGTPSTVNARPFWIQVENVENQTPGIWIYQVNGTQTSIPFKGGKLCMGPTGVRRTPVQSSGGYPPWVHDCSGRFLLDFNAFAAGLAGGNPDPGLLVLGNSYLVQAWGRDRGFAPPNGVTLSDALEVVPLD